MASAEAPELVELKSIIKSIVISAEGNGTISKVARDYEDMEGRAIPFSQYGFATLTAFLRSHIFQNEMFFGSNKDGFEVLKPKSDEKTAHIQDLVRNQKHKAPRKRPAGISRTGNRSAFNFHAAGLGPRMGFNRRPPVVPSQFYNNRSAGAGNRMTNTGFSLNNCQQPAGIRRLPVRPLTTQQTNTQSPPNWPSPQKPPGLTTGQQRPSPLAHSNISSIRPTAQQSFVPKTSTPSTQQAPEFTLTKWKWEEDKKKSSPESARTVTTNFASSSPQAASASKPLPVTAKVCTAAPTAFKAPVIRSAGRGTTPAKQVDCPPGTPVVAVLTIEKLDQLHWLKMKCLLTLYSMKKEASFTGISVTDFSGRFFAIHRTFLNNECQSLGFDDVIMFLEKSFCSSPASPSSSSSNSDDMPISAGSAAGSCDQKRLLKIVANSSLMFMRKNFKILVQQLVNLVVQEEVCKQKPGERGMIPEEFLPAELEHKLKQDLYPYPISCGAIAGLLLKWFFNRFLPSSETGSSVSTRRGINHFCEELAIFSKDLQKLSFGYSLFPEPKDLENLIREMDTSELSDPTAIARGEAADMKWIPIQICSVLTPSHMYVTRVKEQPALNLLSDEMTAFYEMGEGKQSEYLIPIELLSVGQLVAVPMRSRQASATRRTFQPVDQDADSLERRWTRGIIVRTDSVSSSERAFIAHLIDMGCESKFQEARFLMRQRFLDPIHGFDKGFAVKVGLMGVIPPIALYMKQMFADPDSVSEIPVQEIPDRLARKGFPASSVDYIRSNFSSKKLLTASFFKSKRRGVKYEVLIADVTSEETDEFLAECLTSLGYAEQLPVDDALALMTAEVPLEEMLKKRIMIELKAGAN